MSRETILKKEAESLVKEKLDILFQCESESTEIYKIIDTYASFFLP